MFSLLLLSLALLGACGGESQPEAAEAADAASIDAYVDPLEQLREDYRQARCALNVTCSYFPDLETCLSTEALYDIDRLIASIRAGQVLLDQDKAAECFESLHEATSCNFYGADFGTKGQACTEAFVGLVQDGEACASQWECTGDSFCSPLVDCIGNVCTPPVTVDVGESCSVEVGCEPYLACGDAGICEELSEGDPCPGWGTCPKGMWCSEDQGCRVAAQTFGECDPLLELEIGGYLSPTCESKNDYCSSSSRTCEPKKLPEQTCAGELAECVEWAYCDGSTCLVKKSEGEACGPGAGGTCMGDLRCVLSTCQQPPAPDICTL